MYEEPTEAFDRWRAALLSLTGSPEGLVRWQNQRFRFAYRVGQLLTEPIDDVRAVRGSVLYGVYLSQVGLAYVGQTGQAERRLRDLPIGESHHLGMTVPPELWERIVVVQWPSLLAETSPASQAAVNELGAQLTGLALEYLLQLDERPPLNARSRGSNGEWRRRRPEDSRSRGAVNAPVVAELHLRVRDVWHRLASHPSVGSSPYIVAEFAGRTVYPSALIGAIE